MVKKGIVFIFSQRLLELITEILANYYFHIHSPFLIFLALIFRFIFITRCVTTFQENRFYVNSPIMEKTYGRMTPIEDITVIL